MRFGTSLCLLVLLNGTAFAQAALDDAGKPVPTTDPNASPTTTTVSEPPVEYGADIRIRQVIIPSGLLGLFVQKAAGGTSDTGFGLDLVRRRGDLELQLGFEYEHVTPTEGIYLKKGDNIANGDTIDYILSPEHAGTTFGWFTLEFTFLNHAP